MRYLCPKCGETLATKPSSGTCPICDSALVVESGSQEAEPHGDRDGLPSPKRRL